MELSDDVSNQQFLHVTTLSTLEIYFFHHFQQTGHFLLVFLGSTK